MIPIIGIFPSVGSDGKSSVPNTYVRAVEASGAMSLMLPYTSDRGIIKEFVRLCDGFLFTGGVDVEPRLYGETKSPMCGEISPLRDEIELTGFASALESGKPILAICRGCQLVNVALGGSLYQDIGSEYETNIRHSSAPGDYSHAHGVKLIHVSPLYEIMGENGTIPVNSMHHQAIKTLGEGLSVEAEAEDGITEAVYMPRAKFLHAVQWHPERTLDDAYSHRLFDAFVLAAKREKQKTEQ